MLLMRKTDESSQVATPQLTLRRLSLGKVSTMDRRMFLKRPGLAAGVGAFASQLPYGTMTKAQAADDTANIAREVHRTACTHCAVGCSIDAVVENGEWVRQEPRFDAASD